MSVEKGRTNRGRKKGVEKHTCFVKLFCQVVFVCFQQKLFERKIVKLFCECFLLKNNLNDIVCWVFVLVCLFFVCFVLCFVFIVVFVVMCCVCVVLCVMCVVVVMCVVYVLCDVWCDVCDMCCVVMCIVLCV